MVSAERIENSGGNDMSRPLATPSSPLSRPSPTISPAAPPAMAPRCIACAQPRRGHGVTVGAFYLARALAGRGARTLLVELTGRRGQLQRLTSGASIPGLTLWAPHIPAPERLGDALTRARQQAAGKVDVMLLDVDAPYLLRAGGASLGMDYTLIFTEHSETGMREADQLAAKLDDDSLARNSIAAVFSRVSQASVDDLPQRTDQGGLPVLGEAPADYLLAAGDEYSLTSEELRLPHDTYLGAINRLARTLTQVAGITTTTRGDL